MLKTIIPRVAVTAAIALGVVSAPNAWATPGGSGPRPAATASPAWASTAWASAATTSATWASAATASAATAPPIHAHAAISRRRGLRETIKKSWKMFAESCRDLFRHDDVSDYVMRECARDDLRTLERECRERAEQLATNIHGGRPPTWEQSVNARVELPRYERVAHDVPPKYIPGGYEGTCDVEIEVELRLPRPQRHRPYHPQHWNSHQKRGLSMLNSRATAAVVDEARATAALAGGLHRLLRHDRKLRHNLRLACDRLPGKGGCMQAKHVTREMRRIRADLRRLRRGRVIIVRRGHRVDAM